MVQHVGLPAAPETNNPRLPALGNEIGSVLREALRELATKPWMQILGVTSHPSDGQAFAAEFMALTMRHDMDEISSKEYMIRSFGLRAFYGGTFVVRLRALHFPTFVEWLNELTFLINRRHPLKWSVLFHPHPTSILYSLSFTLESDRDVDVIGQCLLRSQIAFPI